MDFFPLFMLKEGLMGVVMKHIDGRYGYIHVKDILARKPVIRAAERGVALKLKESG